MAASKDLGFTAVEIQSYLPGGWTLVDGGEATPKGWVARVRDIAEVEWTVEITPTDVDKLGRTSALKRAVDRVVHKGLG